MAVAASNVISAASSAGGMYEADNRLALLFPPLWKRFARKLRDAVVESSTKLLLSSNRLFFLFLSDPFIDIAGGGVGGGGGGPIRDFNFGSGRLAQSHVSRVPSAPDDSSNDFKIFSVSSRSTSFLERWNARLTYSFNDWGQSFGLTIWFFFCCCLNCFCFCFCVCGRAVWNCSSLALPANAWGTWTGGRGGGLGFAEFFNEKLTPAFRWCDTGAWTDS